VFQVGGSSKRGSLPSLSTPFSREIIEVPRPKKDKMPFVEPFNGTTNLDDHLNVYKA